MTFDDVLYAVLIGASAGAALGQGTAKRPVIGALIGTAGMLALTSKAYPKDQPRIYGPRYYTPSNV